MNEHRKIIKASANLMIEAAKEFGTTRRTVQSALNYETKSPLSNLLRAYIMEHGGKLYELRELDNPYNKVIVFNSSKETT